MMKGNCPIAPPGGWGSQKPPAGVGIDRSHPRAIGLAACIAAQEGAGSTTADSIGNRRYAIGGVGWRGSALYCDGSNAVTITSARAPLLGREEVSVFAWIMLASYGTSGTAYIRQIVGDDNTSGGLNGSIGLRIGTAGTDATKALLYGQVVTTAPARDTLAGTTALSLDRNYMVGYTWRRNGLKSLWINGQLEASGSATNYAIYNGTPVGALRLGDDGARGRYFHGTISSILIYNRSLSALEIKQLYAEQYGMFESSSSFVGASGPARSLIDNTLGVVA